MDCDYSNIFQAIPTLQQISDGSIDDVDFSNIFKENEDETEEDMESINDQGCMIYAPPTNIPKEVRIHLAPLFEASNAKVRIGSNLFTTVLNSTFWILIQLLLVLANFIAQVPVWLGYTKYLRNLVTSKKVDGHLESKNHVMFV